jgi:predicted AAA+ superfamily ATPase
VRSIGSFGRFLELAALESGGIVSFRELSQHVGVSHTAIASYYEILEDCLVAERVDPLTRSRTRKRLTRSPRWLLFDLGVRRLAANEGTRLAPDRLGMLFEQLIGLELIRRVRRDHPGTRLHFWRVPQGPEVDWVLARDGELVPIETKWTTSPEPRQARHLRVFLDEYKTARIAYLVCRTPRRVQIEERIVALPWQDLEAVF